MTVDINSIFAYFKAKKIRYIKNSNQKSRKSREQIEKFYLLVLQGQDNMNCAGDHSSNLCSPLFGA
ncbi:hypothetical protein DSM106972_082340 [Dulcicalothrix desertica PCC 7102]|uniref:Uncharacterized protein n=1 Tax=Dulcicalothrix desertica PCC 7102 TaxID=232991 RepID=A0A3S1ACV3_9CYAN|nr:hypothetical protein [Dulcicalothrix desertica]RUS98015.1 hypothetical protein DSM106972_082340 [Dulcicalothrix desertica PCC 7102]TWH54503.1 hypothetical protein CAL7102_02543 [Dulcicalothrix desertica PCC 7102]